MLLFLPTRIYFVSWKETLDFLYIWKAISKSNESAGTNTSSLVKINFRPFFAFKQVHVEVKKIFLWFGNFINVWNICVICLVGAQPEPISVSIGIKITSDLEWNSYKWSVANDAGETVGSLYPAPLSTWLLQLILYLYKRQIRPKIEDFCYIWAGAAFQFQ